MHGDVLDGLCVHTQEVEGMVAVPLASQWIHMGAGRLWQKTQPDCWDRPQCHGQFWRSISSGMSSRSRWGICCFSPVVPVHPSVSSSWKGVKISLPLEGTFTFWYDPIPDGVASWIGEGGFEDVGLVLGVIGGDDWRADDLLFPGVLSASSIAGLVGSSCRPLGATRARLGTCVLSSEVSLPPVSILCEEFDCVPAAGAAACPAKENALSLLSSAISIVRPRSPTRKLRRRLTADNLWVGICRLSPMYSWCPFDPTVVDIRYEIASKTAHCG